MPTRRRPPEEQPIVLRVPEEEARSRLEEQTTKGERLIGEVQRVQDKDSFRRVSDEYLSWDSFNKTLLGRLLSGPISSEYESSVGIAFIGPSSVHEDIRDRVDDITRSNRKLKSIIERLHLWSDVDDASMPSGGRGQERGQSRLGNRVFIVHGHDNAAKHEVARYLEHIGIDALILNEQPSQGRTLVEKLEHYASQVGFSIVILSPDDVGATASQANNLTGRARQNVIFEMGYFIGLLKRARVCAVLTGDLQRPSDIDGVVYVSLKGNWKTELASELRTAGFSIDMNRVT